MLSVYLNYPARKISARLNTPISSIKIKKAHPRLVFITRGSLASDLAKFMHKTHGFSSCAAKNDMWIQIELGDEALEMDVVRIIRRLLCQHYRPFRKAQVVS